MTTPTTVDSVRTHAKPRPTEAFMVRLHDDRLLEVLLVDEARGRYLLADGSWAQRAELESPRRHLRRRDMQRWRRHDRSQARLALCVLLASGAVLAIACL